MTPLRYWHAVRADRLRAAAALGAFTTADLIEHGVFRNQGTAKNRLRRWRTQGLIEFSDYAAGATVRPLRVRARYRLTAKARELVPGGAGGETAKTPDVEEKPDAAI